MSMVHVRDCRSAAEVMANAREVRARWRQLERRTIEKRCASFEAVVTIPDPADVEVSDPPVAPTVEIVPAAVYALHPDYVEEIARKPLTVRRIINAVCRHFGVTHTDIISARRNKEIVRPRQMLFWLARTMTTKSMPEIGRWTGKRDHTTVLHGYRTIERLRHSDPTIAEHLRQLSEELSDATPPA